MSSSSTRHDFRNPSPPSGSDVLDKLKRSRQRLLDLTLRNRLLNFRPGDPNFHDDLKGHKHIPLKGKIDAVWETLVEDGKKVEVVCLTKDQQVRLQMEFERLKTWRKSEARSESRALVPAASAMWDEAADSIRGVAARAERGDLISLLSEEAFGKRLKRIRHEQNSLVDSTGDSALFLAIGFLEWCEAEPHPKAGQPLFAPLVLIHIHLDEVRAAEGGQRAFYLEMDLDQPQDNPCLAEKLRQDFSIDLPALEDEDTVTSYLGKVRRALKTKKGWAVHNSIALGFFNFARYRLWLDLDPGQWPEGTDPASHEVVKAILNGEWLDQKSSIPTEDEVAEHQESKDLPLVLDADSTQYGSLLAAANGVSMVVVGPPGSGKSQTITNLIAVALNEGKRVLFVAQKLAALAVVQRRLEQVGLNPFCLPIFSDKARVTEVHKHISSSVALRRDSWSSGKHNSASAAVARKLNEHAARLREVPSGYSEDVSWIIRQATALTMKVQDSWGAAWDDRLLEISVPDGQPRQDWTTRREQALHEWHRLKCEVAGTWSHWQPKKLGPLDASKVESAVRQQQESAFQLAASIKKLPELFHAQPVSEIETLVSRVARVKFAPLNEPIQSLINFLWSDPANQSAVARLERDLEELGRQRAKAQAHLRITPETQQYIAQRSTESLKILNSLLSPGHSINEGKAALERLSEMLKLAEDILAHGSLLPDGIPVLGSSGVRDADGPTLTWRHIETLRSHTSTDLTLAPGTKLRFAQHVLEDQSRLSSAKVFIEQLRSFHELTNRLRASVGELDRFRFSEDRAALAAPASTLSQNGFGTVRLREAEELWQSFGEVLNAFEHFERAAAGVLGPQDLEREALRLEDVSGLARFSQAAEGRLLPPPNSLPQLVLRMAPDEISGTTLAEFADRVEHSLGLLSVLKPWFEEIGTDHQANAQHASQLQSLASEIRRLGLGREALRSLPGLRSKVGDLLAIITNAVKACGDIYAGLPLPSPTTIEELRKTHSLLKALAARPPLPEKLAVERLGPSANLAMVLQALGQSANLSEFRCMYASRIAFRDLPSVDEVARVRRVLRPYVDRWWRWLSHRYRSTRQAVCSFLNPPFPSDADALSLLDNLETHERSRLAFEQAPVRSVLGEFFTGIETDWKQIEPVLAWVQDISKLSKREDVTLFIKMAMQKPEGLQEAIAAIGQGLSAWDAVQTDLAFLSPLQELVRASKAPPTALAVETLAGVEQSLSTLCLSGAKIISQHGENSADDLLAKVEGLLEFQSELGVLEDYAFLVSKNDLIALDPAAIRATASWLDDLKACHFEPGITRLLARGQIQESQLRRVGCSAENVCGTLSKLMPHFPVRQPPAWASSGSDVNSTKAVLGAALTAMAEVRRIATTNAFDAHLELTELHDLLAALVEMENLKSLLMPWQDVLREDPQGCSAADLSATLTFLAKLRKAGARGALLEWLLKEQTQSRLDWWQRMILLGQDLGERAKKLQHDFLIPLQNPDMALNAWVSKLADRCASTMSALEVVESYCHSAEFTLHDFAQATAALISAMEMEGKLQDWRGRLGRDPVSLEATNVANHRHWVSAVRNFPAALGNWLAEDAGGARPRDLLQLGSKHRTLVHTLSSTKRLLEEFGDVDGRGPFEVLSSDGLPEEIAARAGRLILNIPLLPSFAGMLRERQRATELGLGNLVTVAEGATVQIELLIETFRAAVAWQQAKAIWESDEGLRLFRSSEFELVRKKFQETDQRQLEQNRKYIAKRLACSEVKEGASGRLPRDLSDFQLLQHEMGKRRKHLPIRKLVQRAGDAMQDLCPCWMMTPLAVAQFLPAGSIAFDLVIMDEASQLNPEDTWGAIARAKQVIVVGDPKQMPPSDFFSSTFEDEETIDDEEVDGGRADSILEASVLSLHNKWLEWHYRSRHESLIAPANQFSYGNRLILFPSSHREHPELGVRYFFIDGAITTTGKVTNPREAERVANRLYELVLAQARKKSGERLSIGVVAMNIHQQECIQDLVDSMRRNDSRFDTAVAALEAECAEPLFIKNLENIQGDERDIMLISCTYGPQTAGGAPAQRFGPLNREGGERRFNVLITRSKWRMEIFASLKSHQIIVEGKKRGVQDFHLFLKYAETGRLDEPGRQTNRGHDSPFEAQVNAVLHQAGYHVECQIGVAGYFIDLAVRHPVDKGRFAIGVECDGKTYHSSKAARDRDRLREQVLRDRGWKLHRIWSTDWFVNPKHARAALLKAVAAACG